MDVTLSVGEHEVTLTVTDAAGNESTNTVLVTVADTGAPEITALVATPSEIWPPNHKMVDVEISADVSDACDEVPVCEIVAVENSERGDGNTRNDTSQSGGMNAKDTG